MSLLVSYAVALIIEGILYKIFGANDVQLNASYVNVERARVRLLHQ